MRRGGAALSGRNQIAGPNICIGIAPTVQIWRTDSAAATHDPHPIPSRQPGGIGERAVKKRSRRIFRHDCVEDFGFIAPIRNAEGITGGSSCKFNIPDIPRPGRTPSRNNIKSVGQMIEPADGSFEIGIGIVDIGFILGVSSRIVWRGGVCIQPHVCAVGEGLTIDADKPKVVCLILNGA